MYKDINKIRLSQEVIRTFCKNKYANKFKNTRKINNILCIKLYIWYLHLISPQEEKSNVGRNKKWQN